MGSIDTWISNLQQNPPQILSEDDLRIVCEKIKEVLIQESSLIPISTPVTICGDIHGQFNDLLELFEVGGQIPDQKYIFLGDYVDRGYHSVETFEYLMLLKLKYPEHIYLLRGNHESRQTTSTYGFYDECIKKYGNSNAWKFCTEIFDYLTIGALVDGKVFCVHGGLSPQIMLLDQLRTIDRIQEVPHSGPFVDLLWSDPESLSNWKPSPRGAGYLFGEQEVLVFNYLNDLDLIARAHQMVMEGFRYMFSTSELVTVWSAPNYCYRCGNVASIMNINEYGERHFHVFEATNHNIATSNKKLKDPYFF